MKEYFSHDYASRIDSKLIKLRMKLGMEGVGIYWCLVEIAYEQGGKIPIDSIEGIAFDLRTQCERISDVLQSYGLFYLDEDCYKSESINKRLEIRNDRSNKAKMSAEARWQKAKNQLSDTNAMRTQCDGNAIKEKKRKEKEIKDILFDQFWIAYHDATKKPKQDKVGAMKYWNKLTKEEKQKAIDMAIPYSYTAETKYLKMARRYLENKSFDDEFTNGYNKFNPAILQH